jgi:hypothetical protein
VRIRDRIKLALFANRLLAALPDKEVMKEKLASRKLWAAVVGSALAAFGNQLGISPEVTTTIVQLIVAYIAGQSVVDAVAANRKPAK